MTTSRWLTHSAAFIAVIGFVLCYPADITYVPSIPIIKGVANFAMMF